MAKLELIEFPSWNNERIRETLLNRISSNLIPLVTDTRDAIQAVVDIGIDEDYPDWYVNNIMEIIRSFLEIVKFQGNNLRPGEFQDRFLKFRNVAIENHKDSQYPNIFYTLPFLENYARNQKIGKETLRFDSTQNEIRKAIGQLTKDGALELKSIQETFEIFKNDADITLALVKKEAGKIGVKEYAEIFEKQALEHSSFFIDLSKNSERTFKMKFLGKAQWWVIFAVVTFGLLICVFTKLDRMFDLKNQYLFTPEVIVHIVGRFLIISLFIFIVSFCFKQFRVNMHLYTLNKHRANTLKSFEYLTRSPDPLAAESYNAILMEVAKAIYESGQTGYINIGDNNADMPSIIDLSKVITQPKN